MKDHRKKVIFEKDKREVREREKHGVKIAGRKDPGEKMESTRVLESVDHISLKNREPAGGAPVEGLRWELYEIHGQICLLFQVSLEFLLLHSSPL